MHKQNIADYILYDMNKNHIKNDFGVNSSLISEIVEGWNRNIYITPNSRVKFHNQYKSTHFNIN